MKNRDSILVMILSGVGYLFFCSTIPSFLSVIVSDMSQGDAVVYYNSYALLNFLTGIVFVLFLYKKFGERLELFHNITGKGILEALAVGFILFLLINFVVSPLLGLIFTTSEANYAQSVKDMYQNPVATFFIVVIIAPLMEELIFRGFLLKRELRWRSVPVSVLLVAFFFGVLHLSVIQGLSAGAAGIILCLFYVKRRSVGLSILAHSFYNGLAYFMMLLSLK